MLPHWCVLYEWFLVYFITIIAGWLKPFTQQQKTYADIRLGHIMKHFHSI